jgi:hypothetical protein
MKIAIELVIQRANKLENEIDTLDFFYFKAKRVLFAYGNPDGHKLLLVFGIAY